MLFDIKPKKKREDLYNFDEEYSRFINTLNEPLIVVRGLRRTGKTSLILTTLEETKSYYIFIDLREGYSSRRDLYRIISKGIEDFMNRLSIKKRLLKYFIEFFKNVRGVSIEGLSIFISWGKDRPLLSEIFRELDFFALKSNLRIIIVFDEIQRIRGNIKRQVENAIAYAYDHLDNLTFILSGSEVGLLYGMIKNPDSPLYGRAYIPISTKKLSKEESLDFLIKGFTELNMDISLSEAEEAVDLLDGIIGWLTYYGYSKYIGGKSLDEIMTDAIQLAKNELKNFLKYRVSKRYYIILKALSEGMRRWSEIKEYLERIEEREVSDRVLHDILNQLKRHSIINEELDFTDPIIREALKRNNF